MGCRVAVYNNAARRLAYDFALGRGDQRAVALIALVQLARPVGEYLAGPRAHSMLTP